MTIKVYGRGVGSANIMETKRAASPDPEDPTEVRTLIILSCYDALECVSLRVINR